MHSEGLEPSTYGFVDRCSIQLSYECEGEDGIRTHDSVNYTPLAGERFRPLSHFSVTMRRQYDHRLHDSLFALERFQIVKDSFNT